MYKTIPWNDQLGKEGCYKTMVRKFREDEPRRKKVIGATPLPLKRDSVAAWGNCSNHLHSQWKKV